MLSGQSLEGREVKYDSLRQSFASLIDSMRFYSRILQLNDEIEALEVERKKRLLAVDELANAISTTIQNAKGQIGEEFISDASKQIPASTKTSLDLTKEKIEESYNKTRKEKEATTVSEKTKFATSLGSFLQTSPFPILETVVTQTLSEGANSAKSTYHCPNELQYEFSLDTRKSSLFAAELRLSRLARVARLPVSLSKGFFSKELKPDYVNLLQFVLTQLELCEGHLIAEFSHPKKQARARVVYTKNNENGKRRDQDPEVEQQPSLPSLSATGSPNLTVSYRDLERKVEVTSEPSLNKFFRSEELVRALDRIWLSASALESNKLLLTSLVVEGRDILTQTEGCREFFSASWKAISPRVTLALKESQMMGANSPDNFAEEYVRSKIALLEGDTAKTILLMLGLKTN